MVKVGVVAFFLQIHQNVHFFGNFFYFVLTKAFSKYNIIFSSVKRRSVIFIG